MLHKIQSNIVKNNSALEVANPADALDEESDSDPKISVIIPPAPEVPEVISEPEQPYPEISRKFAVIDPTTVTQISIIAKKLKFIGIDMNEDRIKISTEKPANREDFLQLSKQQIQEDQYFRTAIRPRSLLEEDSTTVRSIKYTVFSGRNGRKLILRKPIGGDYSSIDANTRAEFNRIKSER